MPHYSEMRCSNCNALADRLRLFIKRVTFASMEVPNKVIRSRTKQWLCNVCIEQDADWNLPAYSGPGHTSEPLERARAIKGDVS